MRTSICRAGLLLLLLSLSACGRFGGEGDPGGLPEESREEDSAFDAEYYRGMHEIRNQRTFDNEFAGLLERRLSRIPDVDDARVIVYADAIIIGVQSSRDDDLLFGRIRQNLREEAGNYQIYMTNRPDMVARISEIHQQIREGKLTPELNREIHRLIGDFAAVAPPLRE